MKQLYPQFIKHIKDSQLIQPGDTILVALSGGKDSVTLIHLLKKMQGDMDFKLVAAYFNHLIRSDTEEEENWVKSFCQKLGIPIHIDRSDVIGFKTKNKLNLEHAASILRTGFLEKTASLYHQCKIATAHSKSDQAETFFIKLLRGSGTRGLSAIYSSKGHHLIRPLLIFSQEEILAFLKRNHLTHYQDYSNHQDMFLRNRMRHHLMPLIKDLSPKIEDHITKTVNQLQSEYQYFSSLAQKLLATHLVLGKILPIRFLNNQHPAIQRHILRQYIHNVKDDLLNIDYEHIEQIIQGMTTSKGLSIPGLELKFHREFIFPRHITVPSYSYRVENPDTIDIQEIGRQLLIAKTATFQKPENNRQVCIPYSKVHFPLTVRSQQKGDRYTKMNASFKQNVVEMIREAGYPKELRNLCPLVIDALGQIIWTVSAPVAAPFKVKDRDNGPFLHLTLK